MPLYDYKCSKCGHIFEVQQRITEEPLQYCPKCKGPIKRLISAAGIVFKGSGFHVTDYGKKGKGPGDSGTKGTEKKTKPKETKSSATEPSPPKSK